MAKTKLNIALIKQAIQIKQSNARQATSHAKTRGEVSGGGKKPWKQKGTGRARAGSSRSPIWVGGGVVFGPSRERNYKLSLPKKMNRKAISELLSYLQSENKLTVVDSLTIKEPRTKAALQLLAKHGDTKLKTLLITAEIQPELLAGTRNLPNVVVVLSDSLSVLDLSSTQHVLIEKKAAESRGLVEKAKAEVKSKTTKPKAK